MFGATEISFAEAQRLLKRFTAGYETFYEQLTRVAQDGAWTEPGSDAVLLSYWPNVGPAAFGVVLFEPLTFAEIQAFETEFGQELPPSLRHFYTHANGLRFGELSVYGILSEFTRRRRQPLELQMGPLWRSSYAACDSDAILFASENVSFEGQVGYFITKAGEIIGRGNGEAEAPGECGQWDSLAAWLSDRMAPDKLRSISS
ncbi:SMI1/KNR4 family protein [Aurantiacibacter odishensis]|uniref:SMI1/KNR4 family protein n=1 Tax=Aurantiacibacter odishensis TaxID=1155476 RepID=UPI0013C3FA82|nr:SMI1/KNR4 family protein [Aurantiacibacter odishensis]